MSLSVLSIPYNVWMISYIKIKFKEKFNFHSRLTCNKNLKQNILNIIWTLNRVNKIFVIVGIYSRDKVVRRRKWRNLLRWFGNCGRYWCLLSGTWPLRFAFRSWGNWLRFAKWWVIYEVNEKSFVCCDIDNAILLETSGKQISLFLEKMHLLLPVVTKISTTINIIRLLSRVLKTCNMCFGNRK